MIVDTSLKAFKRAPAIATSSWYKGMLISTMVSNQESGGAFEFVETKMKRGTEPPPHVHEREDEMFYVLAGAVKVYVGGECLLAEAGECVFLPRRVPHVFRIQSPEIHQLVLVTPGGFLQAGAAMAVPANNLDLPPDDTTYATADLGETIAIFAKVGVRFLSPDEIAREMPLFVRDASQSAS